MLDANGLEAAAKATFAKANEGNLKPETIESLWPSQHLPHWSGLAEAAITAYYLQAVGPEPVGQISDEIADAVREAYRRKVAEYDRDFRDPAMSGEPWKTKYGTNLHSTSLGEQWAMSQALRSALVATPIADSGAPPCWWIDHGSHGQITQREDEASRAIAEGKKVVRYLAQAATPTADERVVEALRPFVTFADISVEKTDDGWVWKNLSQDRICDWFGPTDFGLLQHFAAALAAKPAVKDGGAVVEALPNWNGWRSIDTAPEDWRVILATAGGWVGEAIMLRDEDTGEQVWTWVDTGKPSLHSCYGWMPLPAPLVAPVLSDLRPGGFDGPTGAE